MTSIEQGWQTVRRLFGDYECESAGQFPEVWQYMGFGGSRSQYHVFRHRSLPDRTRAILDAGLEYVQTEACDNPAGDIVTWKADNGSWLYAYVRRSGGGYVYLHTPRRQPILRRLRRLVTGRRS